MTRAVAKLQHAQQPAVRSTPVYSTPVVQYLIRCHLDRVSISHDRPVGESYDLDIRLQMTSARNDEDYSEREIHRSMR